MAFALHGAVFDPEPRGRCSVTIDAGRITEIAPSAAPPEGAIEAASIIPGLIDLQCNGAFGRDFWDPYADLPAIRHRLAASGVTTVVPTLVSSLDDYAAAITRLGRDDTPGLARFVGIHLEGPYIAPAYVGAHDPAALREPDASELAGWLAAGDVALVTLAPELPGAIAAIDILVAGGVVVAIGHTGAGDAAIAAAIGAGAGLATHLFNAMPAFHHRSPGPVGAILDATIPASVIADGAHVAPAALRLAHRALGRDRLILVSDATAALGLEPGPVRLGRFDVVSDGVACRLASGALAGSATDLPTAFQRLVAFGVPFADAVRAASTNPARILGLTDGSGTLSRHGRADVVALGDDGSVVAVVAGGVRVA